MANTAEVSAFSRLAKFTSVDLSDGPIALLSLTQGSYYKVAIKEASSITIIEILNDKIYSICTPAEGRGAKIIDNCLFVSNFADSCNVTIDYYDEFEFLPTNSTTENLVEYKTNGVIEYFGNFRAKNFSATDISVASITPSEIQCDKITIGDWSITANQDGEITIGVSKTGN